MPDGTAFWPDKIIIGSAPQAWERARVGRTKTGDVLHFTPDRTRSWEQAVGMMARVAMMGSAPLEVPVFCMISIELPVPASWSGVKTRRAHAGEVLPAVRPDLDNYAKAVLDGCNGILWKDDAQVVGMMVRKSYAAFPCATLEVFPADFGARLWNTAEITARYDRGAL